MNHFFLAYFRLILLRPVHGMQHTYTSFCRRPLCSLNFEGQRMSRFTEFVMMCEYFAASDCCIAIVLKIISLQGSPLSLAVTKPDLADWFSSGRFGQLDMHADPAARHIPRKPQATRPAERHGEQGCPTHDSQQDLCETT